MNFKKTVIHISIYGVLAGSLMSTPCLATVPTLNLFPTSVVENLQSSADSAKQMEDSMERTVAHLDNQLMLYKDSQCDSTDIDEGCAQIKKGISSSYLNMLKQMSDQLPAMKNAMESTASTLGKNIHIELGKKMTTLDLQRIVQGKKTGVKNIRQRSGKRQGRMSSMLSTKVSEFILPSKRI